MQDRTVLIVGASPGLELALDGLAALALPVRLIPTAGEALRILERSREPNVRAVLVDLRRDGERALEVIRAVRRLPPPLAPPVAVWGSGPTEVGRAYEAGATSGVVLEPSAEEAVRLAAVVYYWAVANEPPPHPLA
ncbi:MAG: hypothetical protein AMXMBFR53_03700 [Gemmatimonadota bacterium]